MPSSLRCISNPTISALINLIAIIFICTSLLQNHLILHGRAVNQSHQPTPNDAPIETSLRASRNNANPIAMVIPQGNAIARPATPLTEDENSKIDRKFYGGAGDKAHLGGFTQFDPQGVAPSLWKHMIKHLGIKSVLDVGCGKGVSTSWFVTHGLEFVQCVEGSHDAVSQNIIPPTDGSYPRVVEHDFSLGAWWPPRTVDAVWCVEFTEHVGRNYQPNYLTAFRSAALIFVTHSNWGGWHHVEVHDDEWWRIRWEAAGLVYSETLTAEARSVARRDQSRTDLTSDMEKGKSYYVGQHLWLSLQVCSKECIYYNSCKLWLLIKL
jgi:hypothetical protein